MKVYNYGVSYRKSKLTVLYIPELARFLRSIYVTLAAAGSAVHKEVIR